MKNLSLSNIFKGDKVIWMVFFFLCITSIIEVYSASSSLSFKKGNYWTPIIYHCGILAVGVFLTVVVLNIKCRYFKLATPFLLIVSIFLLILVWVTGDSTNGASRWLPLGSFQFQPSELAKGTLVLAVAQILSAMQTDNGADRKAFKFIMMISFVIIALILTENLSTAMLLALTVILMMFIGRVPFNQVGKLLGILTLLVTLLLVMVLVIGDEKKAGDPLSAKQNLTEQTIAAQQEEESPGFFSKTLHRADTWKARINKFFSKEYVAPKDYDLDKDAQVAHANIAIASSNILGKGPGNSNERDYLSQAFSDFIYAIIIEEMGLLGAVSVALLYIFLLFRTGIIANRCENTFPAFLAMGIALLLVTQALFNMLVAVGLFPVTGQPLPLISKGGTSTLTNCVYIGVILSVSRSAKKKKEGKATADKLSEATA